MRNDPVAVVKIGKMGKIKQKGGKKTGKWEKNAKQINFTFSVNMAEM